MNKLTKATIAAAAGVVLLLGGSGTLAYWNASTDVGAATIQSGELKVAAATPANPVWKDAAATTLNLSTFRAVPGDVLTFTQDVTVSATGNNLKFTVGLSGSSFTGDQDLIDELTKNATFSVTGANISLVSGNTYKVTTAGSTTVKVTVAVTWGFGTAVDNGSQNRSVSLSAATLTLTQVP